MNELNIDIADYAVKYGMNNNVEYIEARIIATTEETYTARNGRFLGIVQNERQGMGIRILKNGNFAFGSTEKLETKNIESLIDELIKIADGYKRKEPITLSEEKVEVAEWKTEVKIPFKDIAREEKQQFIRDLDKLLKAEVGKSLKNRIAFLFLYTDKKFIVNSEGSKIKSQNSLISMNTMNTAKGKNGTEQRFLSMGSTAGWEWLENEKIIDRIIHDCKGLVKTAQNAKAMKFDKPISVVISGEVSGIMAHENVGHPSEGDRILGREGAQAGESFYGDLLKEKELGEVIIGNECVSIIDDPTIPKSSGFYLYDDECVKARRRYLIKNGRLNELLINREYAARFNTKSNAAARAVMYNREPIPRMANTFFEPGDFTLEELIEDIKEGIFMKSFSEWNIDDRRFMSKYLGQEVYYIKNGEITDIMIKRPVLELTTQGILGNVTAVGKEITTTLGLCGKGDPMQGVPVCIGGPTVKLENIRVGD
ncbi:MAG: TldD/PmbA family protein [Promethearchaeota archaeon]